MEELPLDAAPDVHYVYVTREEKHTHIGLDGGAPNAFLVIVIDNVSARVLGHHILDLNAHYGQKPPV